MSKIPHTTEGFWLKEFKTLKTQKNSRYYIDDITVPIYTIDVVKQSSSFILNHIYKNTNKINLKFGQHLVPWRNLDCINKIQTSFDVSLNTTPYDTDSLSEKTNIVSTLYYNEQNTMCNLYLKCSSIVGYKQSFKPIEGLEAIAVQTLSTLDESCFTTFLVDKTTKNIIQLSNNKLESGSFIVDYFLEIDVAQLEQYCLNILQTQNVQSNCTLNFIFYAPVVSTSFLVDKPVVLYPTGVLKNKVVKEVTFQVSKSLYTSIGKCFKISFIDSLTKEVLYTANSFTNHESFFVSLEDSIKAYPDLKETDSVVSDLQVFPFPSEEFVIKYKIQEDVIKYLSTHLNYEIKVSVSDLTTLDFKIN